MYHGIEKGISHITEKSSALKRRVLEYTLYYQNTKNSTQRSSGCVIHIIVPSGADYTITLYTYNPRRVSPPIGVANLSPLGGFPSRALLHPHTVMLRAEVERRNSKAPNC